MSDRIYREINGISGIFSTRIAYINREGDSQGDYHLRFCDINGDNDQIVLTSQIIEVICYQIYYLIGLLLQGVH